MSRYIQNFMKFQPLLKELVARDIKTKYRRSVLGVLWTLLNPLCTMIVLSVVFSNLFKFDVENYSVLFSCGQVIFNFYSDATTNSMGAIISNASSNKSLCPKVLICIIQSVFELYQPSGIIYSSHSCYDCNKDRVALDGNISCNTIDINCIFFYGSRNAFCSDYCKI